MAHILIPRFHWHLRINDGLPFLWAWLSWPMWPVHNLLLIKGVLQHRDSVWEHEAWSIHLWHKLSNNGLWGRSLCSQCISDLVGEGGEGRGKVWNFWGFGWKHVLEFEKTGCAFCSFGPRPLLYRILRGKIFPKHPEWNKKKEWQQLVRKSKACEKAEHFLIQYFTFFSHLGEAGFILQTVWFVFKHLKFSALGVFFSLSHYTAAPLVPTGPLPVAFVSTSSLEHFSCYTILAELIWLRWYF